MLLRSSTYATGPQLIDRLYRMGDGSKLPIREFFPRPSVECRVRITINVVADLLLTRPLWLTIKEKDKRCKPPTCAVCFWPHHCTFIEKREWRSELCVADGRPRWAYLDKPSGFAGFVGFAYGVS